MLPSLDSLHILLLLLSSSFEHAHTRQSFLSRARLTTTDRVLSTSVACQTLQFLFSLRLAGSELGQTEANGANFLSVSLVLRNDLGSVPAGNFNDIPEEGRVLNLDRLSFSCANAYDEEFRPEIRMAHCCEFYCTTKLR
jgi:hypothetical protein